MSDEKKNYGIELLRLMSMFYVVIIHILMRGGVLESSNGSQYASAYLLKCITYCAVNCFAIITGYVNFSQEPKKFYYSKFLRLWSQVVTYSFGIQLIAFLFGRQRGIGRLLFSAFPILSGQYWFVCCYAGLFLLMPWLNKFLRTIDTKESIRFSTLLFLFFPVLAQWLHILEIHLQLMKDSVYSG
ncbi:Uncharacterized protein conserved in bacteria [uncultured Ruminococcus sp.]|nr:Uncharacterized protein conserved in bacteria [uncultured Ruminococcus sp.]